MPKSRKIKILWVVYDFIQAGGQRYVYEICRGLDKDRFQVDLLKIAAMGHDKNWDKEFYYQPTVDLGCRIVSLTEVLRPSRKSASILRRLHLKLGSNFTRKDATSINPKKIAIESAALSSLLAKYDSVNFSGISAYRTLCIDRNLHPSNAVIHILTAKFQDDQHLYAKYDPTLFYNFVSPIIEESIKIELEGFTNYRYTHFPLCFETAPYDVIKKRRTGPYRIGVFTRLSLMKPLDPYFYALKLLTEAGVDVELIVYGAGSPDALGYSRQLGYLYIGDRVKFMGHTESIPETLQEGELDLIWFQSSNRQPAGYAAFEISMSGLPQAFWDFMDIGSSHEIEETFKSFSSITAFVEYSRTLLLNPTLLTDTGLKQRAYVIQQHSIKKHIHILEELYTTIG